MDGYTHPAYSNGVKLGRDEMDDQQKKDNKNRHKSKTILLNAISYTKYEKITNKDSTKSIFDSFRMTHERNEKVKKNMDQALIQNNEAFKMEKDENIEDIFSRFQNLVAGLKVLNKGYITANQVDKIIRSLPKKWRPMVTTLKGSKDLNRITLKELVRSIRNHDIKLEEDEP